MGLPHLEKQSRGSCPCLPGPRALWYDQCWNWALSHLQHIPLYLRRMLAIQPLQKSGDRLEDSDPSGSKLFPAHFPFNQFWEATVGLGGPEIPQNRYVFGRLDPSWCGRPHHRLIDDPSNQPWLVVTIKIPKTKYTQYLLGWLHLYIL